MGALTFIVYNENYKIYSIEFTNNFLKMKNKGPDDTNYVIEHSLNINKISNDILKMSLSRSELKNYLLHTFIYKYHRLSIHDSSIDANQPFEDPIMHKIKRYPDLRMRTKKKLLCDGVIYNYNQLMEYEKFTDKDIQSSCDVEIILPLYIKYGIEQTLNMIEGDFSLILTENTNTFVLKDINIFCARDKYGIRPLYFIKHNDFYMFTSDMISVPSFILKDTLNYTIEPVPPGCYWTSQTNTFKRFTDYTPRLKELSIISKTDPETLMHIYKSIKELITNSVNTRLYNTNDTDKCMGFLFDEHNNFDSILLITIALKMLNSSFTKDIHIFFINEHTEFIEFLEKSFNYLNLKFHIIHTINTQNYLESMLNYIHINNIPSNVLLSSYGLSQIWNNMNIDFVNNFLYSIEIRFPFLDSNLTNYIQSLDSLLKEKRSYKANSNPIDKYIIRKTFEDSQLLPYELLWIET